MTKALNSKNFMKLFGENWIFSMFSMNQPVFLGLFHLKLPENPIFIGKLHKIFCVKGFCHGSVELHETQNFLSRPMLY